MHTECLLQKNEQNTFLNNECDKKVFNLEESLNAQCGLETKKMDKDFTDKLKSTIQMMVELENLKCQKEKDEQKSNLIEKCLADANSLKENLNKEHESKSQSLTDQLKQSWKS